MNLQNTAKAQIKNFIKTWFSKIVKLLESTFSTHLRHSDASKDVESFTVVVANLS